MGTVLVKFSMLLAAQYFNYPPWNIFWRSKMCGKTIEYGPSNDYWLSAKLFSAINRS